MEVKHKIVKGMCLEFLSPYQFEPIRLVVDEFYDASSGASVEALSSGRLGQAIEIPIDTKTAQKLPALSVVRTCISE